MSISSQFASQTSFHTKLGNLSNDHSLDLVGDHENNLLERLFTIIHTQEHHLSCLNDSNQIFKNFTRKKDGDTNLFGRIDFLRKDVNYFDALHMTFQMLLNEWISSQAEGDVILLQNCRLV